MDEKKDEGGPPSEGDDDDGAAAATTLPAKAGLNRFVWDLRSPDASKFKGLILWAGGTRRAEGRARRVPGPPDRRRARR